MPSKKQLAVIHVAKTRLGMTEPEYRDMLSRVGVTSSKDLNDSQLDEVMRHLEHMGFVLPAGKKFKRPPVESSKGALTRKIYALMADMQLSRAYVDAVARRMCGVGSWVWCDAEQMRKLAAALTYHQKRREAANGRP